MRGLSKEQICCPATLQAVSSFSSSSERCLLVPVTLVTKSQALHTQALLDSGASGCFIDTKFAQHHLVPLVSKTQPRQATLATGDPAPSILKMTQLLDLHIGKHSETLSLDALPLAYPVILGIPWLRKHNPQINWPKNTLCFSSNYCKIQCGSPEGIVIEGVPAQFQSCPSLAPAEAAFPLPLSLTLLSESQSGQPKLPAQYSSYQDVFSKSKSEELPPERRQFDCAIELKDKNDLPPFRAI